MRVTIAFFDLHFIIDINYCRGPIPLAWIKGKISHDRRFRCPKTMYQYLCDDEGKVLDSRHVVSNGQILKLILGVQDGDHVVKVTKNHIVYNGNIICPERDIYPSAWWHSGLPSKVFTGPIRLTLAIQAQDASRFAELVKEYENDNDALCGVDDHGRTLLHHIFSPFCCNNLHLYDTRPYREEMFDALASAVDIEPLLDIECQRGTTVRSDVEKILASRG